MESNDKDLGKRMVHHLSTIGRKELIRFKKYKKSALIVQRGKEIVAIPHTDLPDPDKL